MQKSLCGTDPHCHILPGVDDGAPDLETALGLLEQESRQDVRQVIFTPHFYADQTDVSGFLIRRHRAESAVADLCNETGVRFRVGAEVCMAPELLKLELAPLTIEETEYFLLEWPFSGYPIWGPAVVERVFDLGKMPIFAHIERCGYFFCRPEQLSDYIADGVLCQVNASALLREETQRQTLRLIHDGYVHLIGSDAHNLDQRPPRLAQAYSVVERKLGSDTLAQLKKNADDVFRGHTLHMPEPKSRKRSRHFFR